MVEALHIHNLEGNEPLSIVFNNHAKSTLSADIESSDVLAPIQLADYSSFLATHADGSHLHCVIRNALYFEIVKVNITGSSPGQGLSVDRGQGGTAARDWPAGTLIYQELVADDYESFGQEAIFRTIDYNPNGVLTPSFAGEKVYQSDLLLWWKSVDAVNTEWRLIVGEIVVADPVINPEGGTYSPGDTVSMTCVTPGAVIRYTTDGSTPDANSSQYSAPVEIPFSLSGATIKAIAYGADRWETPSSVITESYTIPEYGYIDELYPTSSIYPEGIWGDGTYLYLGCGGDGVKAYSFDGSDYAEVGSIDDGGAYIGIWGDGTYIYCACLYDGLRAYTFNGTVFSLLDTIDNGGSYHNVWGDGTYIYAACGDQGLRAYSFNGTTFSHLDSINDANPADNPLYGDVWGDGTYIYSAAGNGGLRAYTFNGSTLTATGAYVDVGNFAARHLHGDGTYVYCTDDSIGVFAYSYNGSTFTEIDSYPAYKANIFCSDGYIHLAGDIYVPVQTYATQALYFDGSEFTRIDYDTPNNNESRDVWASGDGFVHLARNYAPSPIGSIRAISFS